MAKFWHRRRIEVIRFFCKSPLLRYSKIIAPNSWENVTPICDHKLHLSLIYIYLFIGTGQTGQKSQDKTAGTGLLEEASSYSDIVE